jgi:hypothetical protein
VTGETTEEDAFKKLKVQLHSVVVTNGPHGAYFAARKC